MVERRSCSIRLVAVVIPACDEAATVERSLAAVERARRRLPPEVASTCVLVADSCTDETEALARSHPIRDLVVLRCEERRAGAARALGTAAAITNALARGCRPDSIWLAHTDADTTVPSGWLEEQRHLGDAGIDGVAGVVRLPLRADANLRRRFRLAYALGADGSHGHVHGANLGVRASTYLAAGGWRSLPTGEDHDLWQRLGRVGNCVPSTALTVTTSPRRQGRAPAGFAADLSELSRTEPVA